jgi:hypothetical protein
MKRIDKQHVILLRKMGKTYKEVGWIAGCSTQRAWEICNDAGLPRQQNYADWRHNQKLAQSALPEANETQQQIDEPKLPVTPYKSLIEWAELQELLEKAA